MSGTGNPGSSAPSSAPAPSSPAPAPASPSPAPAAAPSTSPPPSGAPGGGTAPGGTPSRQEQMGVPSEVVAVLGYDPFGPAEEAPPQPPPTQPQAVPPQPGQPVAQPAVPTQPNELETLRQQLGQVTRELQTLRQPAQPQPGQPGHPAGPIDPVPTYQYEIPDQVLQLMASENPADRKLALGNVMTAVSRSVHGLMQKELAQVIPALARQVMMEHLGQQEVGKDFYSKYSDLDKPHLRPLIYQIAAGWAQQNPQAGWNEQTRDAIARIVYQTFNMQFPGGSPQAQPAPPAAPVMMPTMTRPAVSHMPTEQEELMDLLR